VQSGEIETLAEQHKPLTEQEKTWAELTAGLNERFRRTERRSDTNSGASSYLVEVAWPAMIRAI
jgi:hypothetical protein